MSDSFSLPAKKSFTFKNKPLKHHHSVPNIRTLEGGLNNKIIGTSQRHQVVCWKCCDVIRVFFFLGINGIWDVYRINWKNFTVTPMKRSEEINNFSAENIDVEQKFS